MTRAVGRAGEIGIGELVEAMHSLRPSPHVAERIAASLGLEWRFALPQGRVDKPMVDVPPRGTKAPEEPDVETAPANPAPIELTPVRQASRSLDLSPAQEQSRGTNPLKQPDPNAVATRPIYQPLFRELLWRALVRAMLATSGVTSDVDLDLIIKHASSGRPLERLPWRLKASLRRGVILILDHSDSMQPFWRDQRELIERCGHVIGGPGVRAYWVETDSWSDAEARLRWLQPEPQFLAANTPIVIVSDFELGKEDVPRWPLLTPWLALIDKARAAGAPVLALVPLPKSVWPAALTDAIPNAIPWDDDTTTATVRRALS